MNITQLPPLEYVSRTTYMDGFDDTVERTAITPGAAYIARLVLNPLCERDHAGNYFVLVNDVYIPTREHKAGRLALTPLTPDGTPVEEARTLIYAIQGDGTLCDWRPFLRRIDRDKGYLVHNFDEFDQAFQDFLILDKPRDPVPV